MTEICPALLATNKKPCNHAPSVLHYPFCGKHASWRLKLGLVDMKLYDNMLCVKERKTISKRLLSYGNNTAKVKPTLSTIKEEANNAVIQVAQNAFYLPPVSHFSGTLITATKHSIISERPAIDPELIKRVEALELLSKSNSLMIKQGIKEVNKLMTAVDAIGNFLLRNSRLRNMRRSIKALQQPTTKEDRVVLFTTQVKDRRLSTIEARRVRRIAK